MIQIIGWKSFQSYTDRKPPWIRLHKSLLDNYEYQKMSAEARAILPMLWLLASEDENPVSGTIRFGYEKIAFRLRAKESAVKAACTELEKNGFISITDQQVTESLRNRYETVPSETETETEYTETEYSSCSAILEDLNKKAGTKYRARSQATRRLIQSRLSEGFTIDDFRTVHTKKCQQWIGTEFEKYLRPSTLYQPSKFEGYLNEKNRAGFDKKNDRNMRVIAGWEPDEVSGQRQVSKGDGETGPDIPEAVGA